VRENIAVSAERCVQKLQNFRVPQLVARAGQSCKMATQRRQHGVVRNSFAVSGIVLFRVLETCRDLHVRRTVLHFVLWGCVKEFM
jgi:hypothetical protein